MAHSSGDADVTHNSSPDAFSIDVEQKGVDEAHLRNMTVSHFTWQGVRVTVKDRKTKQPKVILDGIDGAVKAGTRSRQVARARACPNGNRRAHCPHGTQRQWEVYAVERSRAPQCRGGPGGRLHSGQWGQSFAHSLSAAQLVCGTR